MSDLSYWLNYMLIQILLIVFLTKTLSPLVLLEPAPQPDPPPEQDHKTSLSHVMIVKIINKKTLHKNAINQITQCESEPLDIESATIVATLY